LGEVFLNIYLGVSLLVQGPRTGRCLTGSLFSRCFAPAYRLPFSPLTRL